MAKKLIFLFLVFLLTLTSCANVPNPSEMGKVSSERIVIHPDLDDEIGVVSERVRIVGSLPQAEVSIKNFTEDRYTIEYKFDWYDSDGFRIESLSSWNRITLSPNATYEMRSLGKTEKAQGYKLNIRLPDDVFINNSKE